MLRIKSICINGKHQDCKSVNLIIGPNSSGKSTLLHEISAASKQLYLDKNSKWVDSLVLESKSIKPKLQSMFSNINLNNFVVSNKMMDKDFNEYTGFKYFKANLGRNSNGMFNQSLVSEYSEIKEGSVVTYDVLKVIYEDAVQSCNYNLFKFLSHISQVEEFCDSRLNAQLSTSINNILENSDNSLINSLYSNPLLLNIIRKNIKEVFGIDIGFDDLQQGEKHLRILPDKKIKSTKDVKFDARQWKEKSPLISSAGDGIRAYLKLALSILDESNSIVIIDEPEAFLHPPQRRQLGALVSMLSVTSNKQVFISSHDAEFMRGAIQNTNDINVFKTKGYSDNRSLERVDLSDFCAVTTAQPNIINERVLNSFFYQKTIITENESDRVFYEYVSSIYHYNLMQNVNFIGLSGKGGVISLYEKMKNIGVNIGMILDVDFLTDDKYRDSFDNKKAKDAHSRFKMSFNDKGLDRLSLKCRGRNYLNDIDFDIVKLFDDVVFNYKSSNIYIVTVGELESWCNTNKNDISEMVKFVNLKKRKNLSAFLKDVLIK